MKDKLKQIAEKKQKLDALRPLPKELQDNLDEWYQTELTYSSNAIEGNTLSRLETAEVIARGTAAIISGKSLKDQLEAINHAKGIEFVKQIAKKRKSHRHITEQDIKDIHKIILTGIDDNWAGKYRQSEVFIRGSNAEFPMPNRIPHAMKEFIQWLQSIQDENPVKLAADVHFKFVNIHPFIDGNGRTSRLLMNLILTMYDYPMAVIRNEDRIKYLATFDIAREKQDIQPFYNLVEIAVEQSLDAYINAAKREPVMPKFNASQFIVRGKLLKIGELAQETRESVVAIRHWTEKGLLEVAEHTKAGYQLYHRSMAERIKEIRKLQKEKRLSLDEIKQKLRLAS
ncbi:Fic family protein [Candidatus Gottesmanbacteria bacterium]|nr:Fic family protein [Candidatus Gottesmanbacteria bacterium]